MAVMRRSTLFTSLLVLAIVVTIATPRVEALLEPLRVIIRIETTVFCTNGTVDVATPVFLNATVVLECGSEEVATTITDASRRVRIELDPSQTRLSTPPEECNLAVTTPLVKCNASLPTDGIMVAPLDFLNSTINGNLITINKGAGPFQVIPT